MAQPPPAKAVSTRVRKGFAALAANEEKMEAIRQNAEASKYFDGSAPMTRAKREQVRSWFEAFVKACYGETDARQIWAAPTFIVRTKQFLEGATNIAQGKFEEKVKTATLWGYKHAIYWWAAVMVDDFHLMWQKWHTEVSRHIHQLAVQESLSVQSWKKNNLSDTELVLIYDYICEQRYGVDNLKQHWAAMLLTWLTAARPGSFTISSGYQKGAPLGLPGRVRDTGDTLRWSDVEFVHMKAGIAVRVTFRHHKGYRNPNQEGSKFSDARRTFLFLPSKAEKLEFDLSIILFGIAYQRGLFVDELEDILDQHPSEVFLQKVSEINQQAVFVAATQAGRLDLEKPMLNHALNAKLQQICTGIGLLERNTYYSLRRTAIIETRRSHGTEKAKDLAHHVASANSLFFYDNVGFGDVDMQQFRQGGLESMSRDEIRKYFSQTNLARYQSVGDNETTLRQAVDQGVRDRLHASESYVSKETELKQLYQEVGDELEKLQSDGKIPEDEKIPRGFSANDGAKYKALTTKYKLENLTQRIDDTLKSRKALYRALRVQLRKSVVQEIREQHRATLTDSQKQAGRKLSQGGSFEPMRVQDIEVEALDVNASGAMLEQEAVADNTLNEDEDEGVDEELRDADSREEPECWADLQGEVHVQIGGGDSSEQSVEARRKFLEKWIALQDAPIPQSDLLCPRCQLDPTIDQTAKERKFNLFRLKTHMRGNTHSREAQIRRALKQDGKDNTTNIICPICQLPCKGVRNFVKHVKVVHSEQLWEDIEESGEDDAGSGVTDFEGFSDELPDVEAAFPEADDGLGYDMEVTDFEGLSSPAPAYQGKGKGRAE